MFTLKRPFATFAVWTGTIYVLRVVSDQRAKSISAINQLAVRGLIFWDTKDDSTVQCQRAMEQHGSLYIEIKKKIFQISKPLVRQSQNCPSSTMLLYYCWCYCKFTLAVFQSHISSSIFTQLTTCALQIPCGWAVIFPVFFPHFHTSTHIYNTLTNSCARVFPCY